MDESSHRGYSQYVQSTRALWNAWTAHHLDSAHHADVATVCAGGSSLRSLEREALGDVCGKTLLHLQCNMGSDTLSWARLGARVTGVDIADAAIDRARMLARETGLDARFVRSDLYELPAALDEQFDLVVTTYGVLCWLPDVPRWAQVVARYVKPGGVFYLVDMHPLANALELGPTADARVQTFAVAGAYFSRPTPAEEAVKPATTGGTERDAPTKVYAWSYSLAEVVAALLGAGLCIEALGEHPVTFYQRYPALTHSADGWWRWPEGQPALPLLFSLRARKPGDR